MNTNSRMIYVPVEADVDVQWSRDFGWSCAHVSLRNRRIPNDVLSWIEHDIASSFEPTQQEWKDMINYTTRKIEFEVEVEYTEQADGFVKPTNATLQTQGCPNYVKAWLECEAMHQFTKEQEKVKA